MKGLSEKSLWPKQYLELNMAISLRVEIKKLRKYYLGMIRNNMTMHDQRDQKSAPWKQGLILHLYVHSVL